MKKKKHTHWITFFFYGTDFAFIYSFTHQKFSTYLAIRLRPQQCSCYLYRCAAYSIFLGCGSLDSVFFLSLVKLCEIVSLFLYGKQRFMSLNFSRREHSTQPGFIWARTFSFPHGPFASIWALVALWTILRLFFFALQSTRAAGFGRILQLILDGLKSQSNTMHCYRKPTVKIIARIFALAKEALWELTLRPLLFFPPLPPHLSHLFRIGLTSSARTLHPPCARMYWQ